MEQEADVGIILCKRDLLEELLMFRLMSTPSSIRGVCRNEGSQAHHNPKPPPYQTPTDAATHTPPSTTPPTLILPEIYRSR
eukprot:1140878-Pelagomonas_calceolata.AAC.1